MHRGHPVNVPIRRTAYLSSVIPANATKGKRVRTPKFSSPRAGIEPGTSSTSGNCFTLKSYICTSTSTIIWESCSIWRSQNDKNVTHIKGRLQDQANILFNCVPFQMETSLKGKTAPRGRAVPYIMSSSICYGKSLLSH